MMSPISTFLFRQSQHTWELGASRTAIADVEPFAPRLDSWLISLIQARPHPMKIQIPTGIFVGLASLWGKFSGVQHVLPALGPPYG